MKLLLIFASSIASYLMPIQIAMASILSYQVQSNETQHQQIFTKSELGKIPVSTPNIVAGSSKKDVMSDPIIIKMKSECLSKRMKFTLRKIDQVGSTKVYEPICR